MPSILIPDSYTKPLPPLPLDVVRFSAQGPVDDLPDTDALVVWRGMGRKVIDALLSRSKKLRWVQALTAGVDTVLSAPHWRHDIILTNGRGLHDAPTAELAVTLLLSGIRNMHQWRDDQHKKKWDAEAYIRQLNGVGAPTTLEGARVLILGMGSIGLDIARRIAPFGAVIEGVAQRAAVREGFKVHALSSMLEQVEMADAIVAVLPETPETQNIINAAFLARMKPTAWLVNVGRGSAVDEAALYHVLAAKKIAGFASDVFAREPLPTESPLWALENAILTPHIAGGGPRFYDKAGVLLQRNAKAFLQGAPLENVIDTKKGY